MGNSRANLEIRTLLRDENVRNSANIADLQNKLASSETPSSFLTASSLQARFTPRYGAEHPAQLEDISISEDEARVFLGVLEQHTRFDEQDYIKVALPVLGGDLEDSSFSVLRENVAGLLAAGAVALAFAEGNIEQYSQILLQIAVGADAQSELLRSMLTGAFPELPEALDLFKPILLPRDLERMSCVAGVQKAVVAFGGAAAAARVRAWAEGISEIAPNDACPGQSIVIRGQGFENYHARDADIAFTSHNGTAKIAEEVDWLSDTEIKVKVPADTVAGCVCFVQQPSADAASPFAGAGQALAGELERCFGPSAANAANKLKEISTLPLPIAPPCLGDHANMFLGGLPVIRTFTANGVSPIVELTPDTTLTLAWEVDNATSVEILPVKVNDEQHELPRVEAALDLPEGKYQIAAVLGDFPWRAVYELRAHNDCTPDDQPVTMKIEVRMRKAVAIVLGGGGAKGDFEVGALKFLYEQVGIKPDILCGTSVGAINVVKLAEGEDNPDLLTEGQIPGLKGLEWIWRNLMVRNTDMYEMETWPNELPQDVRDQMGLNPPKQHDVGTSHVVATNVGTAWAGMTRPLIVGHVVGPEIAVSLEILIDNTPWAGQLTKCIDFCEGLISIAEKNPRSLFNLRPMKNKMHIYLDVERVTQWGNQGNKLRLAIVGLESGKLRYVTESGQILERNGQTSVTHARIDMIQGVLASASIPGIFPPVDFAGESYVDGGARAMLPVEAALNAGATDIYAIAPSPSPVEPEKLGTYREGGTFNHDSGEFEFKNFLHIVGRTIKDVLPNEVMHDDTTPMLGWGSTRIKVIQPETTLHDALTVHPGYIDIAIDYGYMRAADVVVGRRDDAEERNDEFMKKLATTISEKRMLVLSAEREVRYSTFNRRGPALLELRLKKRELHLLASLRQKYGGVLPDRHERWWQEWERHLWQPETDTPWEKYHDAPAENSPGSIV